jgi:2-hydroxy-3-keto-5-methylthiopentenyl-1-phosphate phosphatase
MEIVSDFDGTIVNIDAVEYLLAQFANGDWRRYDDLYEKGEISLEECLRLQYGMIKEPRQRLLDAVDDVASFRSGFDELLAFSKKKGISFTIVSAGLDFVIRHLLSRKNLQNQIAILAPRSKSTPRGIVLDFSGLLQGDSSNFKSNLVRSVKAKGTRVLYIGDGFSDFEAVKEANIRFVIEGSRLAEQCRKDDIACHEIVGLEEVASYLNGPRTHGRADRETKVA